MSFEQLIADMEVLAKAIPQPGTQDGAADDAAIQALAGGADADDKAATGSAAADVAADGDLDGDAGVDVDGDGDAGAAGDGEQMAKSFSFTLEDGTEVEAVDGTELVKSLGARLDAGQETMLKALGMTVDLIKSQAGQIEAMGARMDAMAGEGRGRKTLLAVSEKVTPAAGNLQKSQAVGLSHKEFFAKADIAQKAGRITAVEVCTAEAYLNKGQAVPAHIIQRVLG